MNARVQMMEFAERLIAVRSRRHVTQQDLADRSGVHVTQLRRYEAGTAEPSLRVLRKMAVALSVTTDEMLFDDTSRPEDTDLRLAFEQAANLTPEERAALRLVLDGLSAHHDQTHRPPGSRRRQAKNA